MSEECHGSKKFSDLQRALNQHSYHPDDAVGGFYFHAPNAYSVFIGHRDSNFEFDEFTLDNAARKFYEAESDLLIPTNKSNPLEDQFSVSDAIRANGQCMVVGSIDLPEVPSAVAEECMREIAEWENKRKTANSLMDARVTAYLKIAGRRRL